MGLSICLAIIAHTVLIFGISFAIDDDKDEHYDTLEVMLVQKSSKDAPENADFLAQQNLEGGGESDEAERPATPFISPNPEQAPNLVTPSAMSAPTQPSNEQLAEQETTAKQKTSKDPDKETEREEENKLKADEIIAAETDKADNPLTSNENKQAPQADDGQDKLEAAQPQTESPSAAHLMSRTLEMASLSAEIERRLEAKAKRPHRKFISASTREYKYAAYMESWRAKVERIGNINYPEVARKKGLSGTLILDVALNPDGTINDIVIKKTSGFIELDKAALDIVRLASPFAAFPEDIRDEVDILHITRTWKFLHNQKFSAR